MLVSLGAPASAHRLDEYLQATTISLEPHRVQMQIRLTPGVAVFPLVMAAIDTNGDGVIATSEQRAYAGRVLGDLSLAVDGERLTLQLISTNFPTTDEMREGRGTFRSTSQPASPATVRPANWFSKTVARGRFRSIW